MIMALRKRVKTVEIEQEAPPVAHPAQMAQQTEMFDGNNQPSQALHVSAQKAVKQAQEAPEPAPQQAPAATAMVTTQKREENVPATTGGDLTPMGRALAASSSGAIQGDFDYTDVKFPQLKVVQGSGQMSGTYGQGTVLLGDEVLAYPPRDLKDRSQFLSLRFVPFTMKKWFRETLTAEEQETGMLPRSVDSVQAVIRAGGTVGYGGWRPAGEHHILIEQPEGADNGMFNLELDGKRYCPAVFWANSGNYRDFTQPIFNACSGVLRNPLLDKSGKPVIGDNGFPVHSICLHKFVWEWRLVRKQAGDFWVWRTDSVRLPEETGEQLHAWCAESLSGMEVSDAE